MSSSGELLPIRFNEIMQLTSVGISPQSIGFATLTMESDKYICVRETSGDNSMLFVIDTKNPSNILKKPVKGVDSAIMNPVDNVLALKADRQLQVFDLERKNKLAETVIENKVVFWRWLNRTHIALVTPNDIYHWNVTDGSSPVKVFDRLPALNDSQIILYRTSDDLSWCCLGGIAKRDERIIGSLQLYSVERKQSQSLEGHAAAFSEFVTDDGTKTTLFSFASRAPNGQAKLFVSEVSGTGKFKKAQLDLYFPPEADQDFPVSMQISSKFHVIYVVTKFGYLHMIDLSTVKLLYMNRISADTIFVTVLQPESGGMLGVNRRGQLLSVTVDEANLVRYIASKLGDYSLAIAVAKKSGLPGAESMFQQQFQQLVQRGQYAEAAAVAADSPRGFLRTSETVRLFGALPMAQGQRPPLLQYFSVLMERGKLNSVESVELARLVIQQGRRELLEQWLRDDKLECSEELGNLVMPDAKLAVAVYSRADAKEKVIQCLAEAGEYDRIVPYAQKVGFQPDYAALLQRLLASGNAKAAGEFAGVLVNAPDGPLVELQRVFDIFVQRNLVQNVTALLFEKLKENKPEYAGLQTALLEVNIRAAPQVADAILASKVFSHYNRAHVAMLCEQNGLPQRALEQYSDIADIRRVIAGTAGKTTLPSEFVLSFVEPLSAEDKVEVMRELLSASARTYVQTVSSMAVRYAQELEPKVVIPLFDNIGSHEGLYFYLGSLVGTTRDADVVLSFIDAATRLGHFADVERVVRENTAYDAVKVREYLKTANLPDMRPLVVLCDKHGMVEDLTQWLYKHNLAQYIEAYVLQINPARTPVVVGALLDADCPEDYVRKLVMQVRNMCPVEELVQEVEKRNRLKLLQPWLEARVSEGNTETATHNALLKVYVEVGKDAEQHLQSNSHYDSAVLGAYCENRDPYLAFVAYRRGRCDTELIEMCNRNALFKYEARYLVSRQDPALWGGVLRSDNEHMREVVDEVVQTALPESDSPEEVSSTVKAFMAANLPLELITLLEKIVLESTQFSGNRNLQNLLILTAIKADKGRVAEYLSRLDNFDAAEIAEIAIKEDLFEEAFEMYRKAQLVEKAIEVLLYHIQDMDRAADFADRFDNPRCYARLAKALLDAGRVQDSIAAYIKSGDPAANVEVVAAAERAGAWGELEKYLRMCKNKLKEPQIDSELAYTLAKLGQLSELEAFITSPNYAQVERIGDRCYDEEMFEAAKLLFGAAHNHARLASTLVRLGQYSAAVEAARKANSAKTWRALNLHLLDKSEFRLAAIAGLQLIVHADELPEVVKEYETRGLFKENIALMEAGLGLERAHVGLFTQLAVAYSKYEPEKLQEHLVMYGDRLNVPKVIRVVERNQQWSNLAYLHDIYREPDHAIQVMMDHPTLAWEHAKFRELAAKVHNAETLYKAVQFYLDFQPMLVNELLAAVRARVDPKRIVSIVAKNKLLPLLRPWLVQVQEDNVARVNDALHQLYIEEEDAPALAASIAKFDQFDKAELAQQLEKHELLDMRKIAAELYKSLGKFEKAMQLLEGDESQKDAISTANDSRDPQVVERLLRRFAERGQRECFAAALHTCFHLVPPDLALELAWRHNMMDYAMPFLIQFLHIAGRAGAPQPPQGAPPGSSVGTPPDGMAYAVDPNTGQYVLVPAQQQYY